FVGGVVDDGPAGRLVGEYRGVVEQRVGAPLERDAVVHAIDRVERRILEIRLEVLPVGDQVDVHGLDVAPVDQAQVRVTGSRDHVPLPAAAVLHQADHLVRRSSGVLVDLAAGRLGERVDPRFVGVAVPQDQVQLTLAGADGG